MNSNESKSDNPLNINTEYYHECGSLPIQKRHMPSNMGLAEGSPLASIRSLWLFRVLMTGQGDRGHYHTSLGYPESWLCPPDNHRYIPWREGGKEGGGGEGNRDEIRSQWYSLPHACMCRRGKAMPSCLCICVSVGQRILKNISSTVAKAF